MCLTATANSETHGRQVDTRERNYIKYESKKKFSYEINSINIIHQML